MELAAVGVNLGVCHGIRTEVTAARVVRGLTGKRESRLSACRRTKIVKGNTWRPPFRTPEMLNVKLRRLDECVARWAAVGLDLMLVVWSVGYECPSGIQVPDAVSPCSPHGKRGCRS